VTDRVSRALGKPAVEGSYVYLSTATIRNESKISARFKGLYSAIFRRMTLKVTQGHRNFDYTNFHFLLVISSNNISGLHRFPYTTTFTVYMTACINFKAEFETVVKIQQLRHLGCLFRATRYSLVLKKDH